MTDPIAYFITLVTYGTWLPGDQRGWIEYGNGWRSPDFRREFEAFSKMAEDRKILDVYQRLIVEQQIKETCEYRKWVCHAVNCRTNHVHTVISAPDVSAKKVRSDIKAWCTKRLRERDYSGETQTWWADRGSVRWVFSEEDLNQVIRYTRDMQ